MATPKTNKKQSERGAQNKQRIYMQEPLRKALSKVCELRGESISEALTKKAKALIRANAPLLRKHNYQVPVEAFE